MGITRYNKSVIKVNVILVVTMMLWTQSFVPVLKIKGYKPKGQGGGGLSLFTFILSDFIGTDINWTLEALAFISNKF